MNRAWRGEECVLENILALAVVGFFTGLGVLAFTAVHIWAASNELLYTGGTSRMKKVVGQRKLDALVQACPWVGEVRITTRAATCCWIEHEEAKP